MEQTYKIIGIQSMKGYKKLELQPLENLVQEEYKVDTMGLLKNIGGFMKDVQTMYTKDQAIDILRIPDKVFNEKELQLDGTLTITY